MKRLQRLFRERMDQRRPKGYRWSGLLGDFDGNITANRPGEVWVRVRQAGSSGYGLGSFPNRGNVRPWYNLPVYIEMDPLTGEQYVVGTDQLALAYGEQAGNDTPDDGIDEIPPHGQYHGWGGDDQISWLHSLQLFPLRVQPSASSEEVVIQPGVYYAEGQICVLSAAITVDLSSYTPVLGGSTYLLIYIDASKQADIVELGTSMAGADLPPKGAYALSVVRLNHDGVVGWQDLGADFRFVPQDTGTNFTRLLDVPDSYAGEAGKPFVVNDAEDGLEAGPTVLLVHKYDAAVAPTVDDDSGDGYAPGSLWVDVTNDKAYVCIDASSGAAVWHEVMDVGHYDADGDGLIDTAHGGTELDTSGSTGIPHLLSAGTWSVLHRLSPGADSEVAISGGEITVTQLYHRVDTESDAASDDLATINGLADDGELLILHPENDDRTVVLKHGMGNIYVPGGSDITMDEYEYHVLLIYDAESASWCVLGAGAGGGGASALDDLTDVDAASPSDGDRLAYDAASGDWINSPATSGEAASDPIWHVPGAIVAATEAEGAYVCPRDATIVAVYVYCADPGSASSTIVDVNKNGTSIFASTPANRPTLAYDDADQVAKSGAPDTTALTENDVLTIDIDQAATGAEDLTVIVELAIGDRPSVRVWRTTDQTIPNETTTLLSFSAELWDTDGMWDSGNPTKLICAVPGKYMIGVEALLYNSTSGERNLSIRKNGTEEWAFIVPAAPGGYTGVLVNGMVDLEVDDEVTFQMYQTSGTSLSVMGSWSGTYCQAYMYRVGE